jgi:hypothetical protein
LADARAQLKVGRGLRGGTVTADAHWMQIRGNVAKSCQDDDVSLDQYPQ